jgi:hypothetical protein
MTNDALAAVPREQSSSGWAMGALGSGNAGVWIDAAGPPRSGARRTRRARFASAATWREQWSRRVEPLARRSSRPVAVVGDYREEFSVSDGGTGVARKQPLGI